MFFFSPMMLQSTGGAVVYYYTTHSALHDSTRWMTRTPSVSGNGSTYTFSTWVRNLVPQTAVQAILSAGDGTGGSSGNRTMLFINTIASSNKILFSLNEGGSNIFTIESVNGWDTLYKQYAWNHMVLAVDTTQAVETDRVKMWVNGSSVAFTGASTYPALNEITDMNTNQEHTIGRSVYDTAPTLDTLFAETYIIDGLALKPADFADNVTGAPIEYTGSFGTNGVYLKYADSGNLGLDSSPNGNNWTDVTTIQSVTTPFAEPALFSGWYDGADRMTRTIDATTDRQRWVLSAWVRLNTLNATQVLFMAGNGVNNRTELYWDGTANQLAFLHTTGSATIAKTNASLDQARWYHVFIKVDTTQATASDRVEFWVDGVLEAHAAGSAYPAQNTQTHINNISFSHAVGARSYEASGYIDGHIAETHFFDGVLPTVDKLYNSGAPVQYAGDYGRQGFYHSYRTAASPGRDDSGNSNIYTNSGVVQSFGIDRITFEGSHSQTISGVSATFNYSQLTNSYTHQAGDVAVLIFTTGRQSTTAQPLLTEGNPSNFGYTQIYFDWANDSRDVNTWVWVKVLDGTETTVLVAKNGATGGTVAMGKLMVFSGVDNTTLQDVALTANKQLDTGNYSFTPITPVTAGAKIIAIGTNSATTQGASSESTGAIDFSSHTGGSTTCSSMGVGVYEWVSGAFAPTMSWNATDNLNNSSISLQIALRPSLPPQ